MIKHYLKIWCFEPDKSQVKTLKKEPKYEWEHSMNLMWREILIDVILYDFLIKNKIRNYSFLFIFSQKILMF